MDAVRKLGELLIAEGAITQEQLTAAIAEHERTGERLGEILLARRSVSRLNLANAMTEQHTAGRLPTAAPGPSADPGPEPDLASKLAQVDALLARLVLTTGELDERLGALEALIPAISDALR